MQIFPSVRQVFARYWPYLRPDRYAIGWVILGILGLAVTNTLLVWAISAPFDRLQAGRFEAIPPLLLNVAGLIVLNMGFHLLAAAMTSWLGLRFVGRVRQALLDHIMFLSTPGLAGYSRGDLLARLSKDVDGIESSIVELPLFLLSHVVIILFYGTMLFWVNWHLALVACVFVPLLYFYQHLFAPWKRRASQAYFTANGNLLNLEEQTLSSLPLINALTAESHFAGRHGRVFELARRAAMWLQLLGAGFQGGMTLLVYVAALGVVFAGIREIAAATLSLGALVSFLVYLGYLSVPVRGLAQAPGQWQGNLGAVMRVSALFETQPVVQERPAARSLQRVRGEIHLDRLSFAFGEGGRVLHNVTLTIPAGVTVAVVGPSGAGKSTLMRLLLRFHDPQQGAITIDGIDIRDVTLASLRAQMSVVWQEAPLFNDTVRANLLLARPAADDAMLERALRQAQAWDFVATLPGGLAAPLGAGGVEISGGQRQRLALAQALLRDTPILLLDEATAALDGETERAVVEALNEARRGRTTLVIAHRYASIRAADQVLYLNGDGSAQLGSHAALYATHEAYRRALAWQLGQE